RLADLRLLGVLEAAALRDREIVDAAFGELDSEPHGVVDTASALHDLVAEVADADRVVGADARAHRREDVERQPRAMRERSPLAVRARVEAGEERRHRLGMVVVELDAGRGRAPQPAR